MSIDPRQLAYILAIDEYGSLSRAAEALGVSQPALSNSIALLERRLGVQILTRTGRGAVVNPIGALLVRRARELRSILAAAEVEVRLKKNGQSGPLSIGATPSVVEHLVPAALNLLRRDAAHLSISVIEGLDAPLNEQLLNGDLDLVIGAVGQPGSPADLAEEFLFDDPFLLGVGLASPLAKQTEISLSATRDQLWVMPRPGGSAHAYVSAIFLNGGVAWPQDCISTNSVVLTKQLLIQSDAVALVNAVALAGWRAPIHAVRVPEAGSRKLGVRRRGRGDLSPLAVRFLDYLREVSADLQNLEAQLSAKTA
jgi:DNA-binding transcriptional LysR family regulator